jgi:hypothetical protein
LPRALLTADSRGRAGGGRLTQRSWQRGVVARAPPVRRCRLVVGARVGRGLHSDDRRWGRVAVMVEGSNGVGRGRRWWLEVGRRGRAWVRWTSVPAGWGRDGSVGGGFRVEALGGGRRWGGVER